MRPLQEPLQIESQTKPVNEQNPEIKYKRAYWDIPRSEYIEHYNP